MQTRRPRRSASFAIAVLNLTALMPAIAAESADPGEQLEEVTVTAQRYAEPAQSVPISVTAYSAAELQSIGAVLSDDLPVMVAGLQMQPVGAFQPITLRGVGNNGNGAAVLTFVDGIYHPFQTGSLVFGNAVRVEVDKGPQGTLFGRNSTGGVIQVTTADPQFAPAADVSVGYGNYDTRTLRLYATTGVTPRLAGNIAVSVLDQNDGWGTNLVTGKDVFTKEDVSIRSKWLFDAGDGTTLKLILHYSTSEGSEGTIVKPAAGNDTIFDYVTNTLLSLPGNYDVAANYAPRYVTRTRGASFRIDSDFDAFSFASISSWQDNRTELNIDYDGTPFRFFDLYRYETRDAVTQEFQIRSPQESRLKWVSGLFFYNDHGNLDPFRFSGLGAQLIFGKPPGAAFNIIANDRVTSYAAFGQVTAPIPFDSKLTLGARYTLDQRRIAGFTAGDSVVTPGSQGKESENFEKLTFRIALDHSFTADVLGYLSFNRGFNGGFFNLISTGGFTPAANPAVDPETIDAFELGLKSEWLDKRLRANLSAFRYDYRNLQQQVYQSAALVTVNAAAARITGIDMDLQARPIGSLTLAVGLEVLHGTFTRYPDAPLYSTGVLGQLDTVAGDAADKDVPNAPRFSATARATYRLSRAFGSLDSTIAFNYVDAWFADPGNYFREPSHSVLNLTETWTSPDGRTYASLWGKNLGASEYDLGINMLAPVGPVGNPGAPRTYGITVGHRF